jgi:hypothetical protein
MMAPGYRPNSATEFPELERLGIDQELDGISGIGTNSQRFPRIPMNSRITTYMGLYANDGPCLSIEFRYGMPELERLGID